MQFQHLILTPFYLRRQLGNGVMRPLPPAEWLQERLELFEKYCFPTVAQQTVQDFDWLVLFDPETPADALAEFRRIVGDRANVHLCFADVFTKETLVEVVKQKIDPAADWVLTTRFDNDDGWHERFVERIQAEVRPGTREFLNFPRGYIVAEDRAYLYEHLSNAFISLSESPAELTTPFATNHERLAELAPIRQIEGPPAFYQLVHGGNFSNKVRGTRTPIARARKDFDNLKYALSSGDRENALAVGLENLTLGTLRGARDGAIKIYKRFRYGPPVREEHAPG